MRMLYEEKKCRHGMLRRRPAERGSRRKAEAAFELGVRRMERAKPRQGARCSERGFTG